MTTSYWNLLIRTSNESLESQQKGGSTKSSQSRKNVEESLVVPKNGKLENGPFCFGMVLYFLGTNLESWVDCEAAGSGVHAGHVLYLPDLLLAQLHPVVPVPVVQVLSQQSVGLHCEVLVNLRHKKRIDYQKFRRRKFCRQKSRRC